MTESYLKKEYASLGAAIDAALSDAKPTWKSRSSRSQCDSGWSGTSTFDEAVTLAKQGWQSGRQQMLAASQCAVNASAMGRAPSFAYDVAGAYPMAALAAAGDAFCMVSPAPVNDRARPIVRLAISAANSQSVRAERIFNYGAALLSIIDGLESADFRCELTVVYAGEKRDHKNLFNICIKQADEILDYDRMAFAFANPAMFRRIIFSLYELHLPIMYEYSYGTPRIPQRGKDIDDDMILLPSAQSFDSNSMDSPERALRTIKPVISNLLLDRFGHIPEIIFNAA